MIDAPLSKTKLIDKLKSRMISVDSSTMNDRLFLYSIGYNAAISSILIDEANGEFKQDNDK